jgi:predicted nucleic acid-binding protein
LQLIQSVSSDFLQLLPLAGDEAEPIAAIMHRYEEVQPQLADAALVYLANREQIDTVFTLDRRDFSIYRYGRRGVFRIVPQVE